MPTPFFIAESPQVTVMRTLASSAYGGYTLNLPEGIELEDVHDFDAPGNTLGYVAVLERTRRVGGLARRFIRADVEITATDPSDPDVVPESDVHMVLDEAKTRVSSDFFLESDITKAGLGPWVPYQDFTVGDIAKIDVMGHIVELPATRIESQITDHDDVDWVVHYGGQLVDDEQARLVENMAIEKKVLQDRRELMGVEGAAKNAKKAADSAQSTADGVRGDLDDTEVQAVEEEWAPPSTGWQGAVETLNRNFLEFRSFQTDTNAELQKRIQAHEDMILDLQDAKKRALASISRTVISHGSAVADPESKFIRASISGSTVRVEAIGSWKGTVAVEVISSRSIEGTSIAEPSHRLLAIPDPGFNRVWEQRFTGIGVSPISVQAIANIQPGVLDEKNFPISSFRVDRDKWHTVKSFRTTHAGAHTIMGTVGWHAATYDDTYGMRLMVGSQVVAEITPRTRVGPLTILGNGYVKWILDIRDRVIPAGTDIKLEAWAGATGNDQRTIRDGGLRVWWIAEE